MKSTYRSVDDSVSDQPDRPGSKMLILCRSASPPPSRGGRASSSPPPKSPQSPRRTGRSELTPKLQLEAEADRLLMIKQVSKQVICHFREQAGHQLGACLRCMLLHSKARGTVVAGLLFRVHIVQVEESSH